MLSRSSFFSCYWAGPLLLALGGCVESYVPDVATPTTGYLVVDGFINGNGATRIRLSRTVALSTTTAPPPEKGATLLLVDDAGTRYALKEKSPGFYQSDSLLLSPARLYQLRIATTGTRAANYASDLVPLKVSPPIDKLVFALAGDQVQLRVDTHDAAAQSHYYRWNFAETWQFNAAFPSSLEYNLNALPNQSPLEPRSTPIYTCWRTERPSAVVQTTTAPLAQDAVTGYVVRSLPARAERFKVRYSVLVSQYVETAAEFAYYELLRKNTEAVGTVNDPLPSQLTGNVHRVGNPEPVLGFVGAHTAQYKRIFVTRAELPPRDFSDYDTPYNDCATAALYYCDPGGKPCDAPGVVNLFRQPENVPLQKLNDPDFGEGILSASADCADCRTRGSNVKPSFW